jgi:hypothetical protein
MHARVDIATLNAPHQYDESIISSSQFGFSVCSVVAGRNRTVETSDACARPVSDTRA